MWDLMITVLDGSPEEITLWEHSDHRQIAVRQIQTHYVRRRELREKGSLRAQSFVRLRHAVVQRTLRTHHIRYITHTPSKQQHTLIMTCAADAAGVRRRIKSNQSTLCVRNSERRGCWAFGCHLALWYFEFKIQKDLFPRWWCARECLRNWSRQANGDVNKIHVWRRWTSKTNIWGTRRNRK